MLRRRMTRPLPLRAEQPPDDATIIVRAGVMSADSLRRAAQRSFDLYAVLGISVEAVIGTTVQDACRSDRVIAYRRVRLSTSDASEPKASRYWPPSTPPLHGGAP